VLRKIFGPKREEGTGDWRKIHSEELHDLHSSPNTERSAENRTHLYNLHYYSLFSNITAH
jgi:hypothetical protein